MPTPGFLLVALRPEQPCCKVVLLICFCLIVYLFPLSAQDMVYVPDSVPAKLNRFDKAVKIMGVALPSAMIGYGAVSFISKAIKELDHSTKDELIEDHLLWDSDWDDYLMFSPAIAAFGMKLGGVKSTHKMPDMLILYGLSNLLESGIIFTTKRATARRRPDDSNNHSFPSSHTASAFVAAEFLHQEYGHRSAWISAGGYGMATLIGVFRVYNNKHWVSDVVAGAGVGILSTKLVYLTYPHLRRLFSRKGKRLNALIVPTYSEGKPGLNFAFVF